MIQEAQSIRYIADRVEVGLGAGIYLVLPVPPLDDDYDYALLWRFYGPGVDPARFLLSARRPQAPEHVLPSEAGKDSRLPAEV